MHRNRFRTRPLPLLACLLLVVGQGRTQQVDFVASTAALEYAVRAYEGIWEQYGSEIVASLEARTCLPFAESRVTAIVADAVSNSGGPEHPMRLRASYAPDIKQSTLVHELGHRHLWQLAERLDEVDGHKTLYLVLDLVWEDVWGRDFAEQRVSGESSWEMSYDYGEAWRWARSLAPAERTRLWGELLALNGLAAGCDGLVRPAGSPRTVRTGPG